MKLLMRVVAAGVCLLLGSTVLPSTVLAQGRDATAPHLPRRELTPGAVLTRDTADVCTPGWATRHRHTSTALKRRVYEAYGIRSHTPGEYEVDHLISLQLGGDDTFANLWPERYAMPLGAYAKDSVENFAHAEVCAGRMRLATAQHRIARDWTSLYRHMHHVMALRALPRPLPRPLPLR